MNRTAAIAATAFLTIIIGFQGFVPLNAEQGAASFRVAAAQTALEVARLQQRSARQRAERLEAEARRSREASTKAQVGAAALAARVQQAEARIAAAEAELALVEREQRTLSRHLAQRREPLAQLTAALQTMAHRPLALTALQPGSLGDIVHTRAVLASALPIVQRRTAALRSDLQRVHRLQSEKRGFLADRIRAEQVLAQRRTDMLAIAEKERVLAMQAAGGANREADLAIELAEEARDLDALVNRLGQSAALRQRLAKLDGPLVRPARPGAASLPSASAESKSSEANAPTSYLLPVSGRVVSGFGEAAETGGRRPGISILSRPRAQVVAPAAGRVSFAGPYEGYRHIVIIEHESGWTSLLTGLGTLSVATGQRLAAGSPLGLAARSDPTTTFELSRDGEPVNPLDHLR